MLDMEMGLICVPRSPATSKISGHGDLNAPPVVVLSSTLKELKAFAALHPAKLSLSLPNNLASSLVAMPYGKLCLAEYPRRQEVCKSSRTSAIASESVSLSVPPGRTVRAGDSTSMRSMSDESVSLNSIAMLKPLYTQTLNCVLSNNTFKITST